MSIRQEDLQILGEMVEKIMFDPPELEELKTLITAVSVQELPARKLKERIIELRGSMMTSILKLFPFYNKSLTNQKEIDDFGNDNSEIIKELEEKNSILEQVGNKLQELEMKLQEEFIE